MDNDILHTACIKIVKKQFFHYTFTVHKPILYLCQIHKKDRELYTMN